jgi:hypothetical protein
MASPAALYCVVWKDNCSNMNAVSYGLVKWGTLSILDKYIYCVWTMCGSLVICGTVSVPSVQGEWVSVDYVWLTGHLWNSECTVCAGWVSECGPCVAHWSSVEQWVYRLCRVSEWVWTRGVSILNVAPVSVPSVQGVWVSVDHVWLTGHLWKSECTVCVGWVSEWVWTMCGSLVVCGTVSVPSVQGECCVNFDATSGHECRVRLHTWPLGFL